jgi:hypothetical protein
MFVGVHPARHEDRGVADCIHQSAVGELTTPCPLPVEADMRALGRNAVYDPEQTLDVWPHLRFGRGVRAVANYGWSRYAALTV